jgi:hypothetical protein
MKSSPIAEEVMLKSNPAVAHGNEVIPLKFTKRTQFLD